MAGFELLDEDEVAGAPAPAKGFVMLDEPAPPTWGEVAKDVGKSAGSKYLEGAISLIGAPIDIPQAVEQGTRAASRWFTGQTPEEQEASLRETAFGYSLKDTIPAINVAGTIKDNLSRLAGREFYEPKYWQGQAVGTVAEMVPGAVMGPGGVVRRAVTGAVVPGVAAETAGNLPGVKGTALEPWVRGGAAVTAGGGAAIATAPKTAERALSDATRHLKPAVFAQAQRLIDDAAAMGVRLTGDEAIQQVTGGATRLGDLRRVVEGSRGGGDVLKPLMAERPGQVRRAGERELNAFGEVPDPMRTGLGVRNAATTELRNAQTAVNAATQPDYLAAGRARLGPQIQEALETDPLYVHHLNEVRNTPGLNRGIEHLPNDSVDVVNLVQQRMREAAEAARMPGQASSSNLIAANLEDARTAPLEAAETVTGGAYGDFARARARQGQLRREFLEPLTEGPVGQVSRTADVGEQARTVFPAAPNPGSERWAAETVGRVARQDPQAAQGLVRTHLQSAFDEATQNLASGPNQFGGAKFAAVVAGNGQQARNLEAAVRALPEGNLRWEGFRRFLDVLETTGQRPQPGSATSFNEAIKADLKAGSVAGDVATAAKTGGLSLVKRFTDFRERLNLGRNTEQIAAILTRPDSGRVLARLAREPAGSSRAGVLALRLSYMGRQAANGSAPPTITED